jgi:hypothetical protein
MMQKPLSKLLPSNIRSFVARMAVPKFGQKWFLFLFKSQQLNFSMNKYASKDGSAKKQN